MPKYLCVDEFIEAQSKSIQAIIFALDRLIMVSDIRFKTHLGFNTVFYKLKHEVIYIGKIREKTGLELCFMRGLLLKNSHGLLDNKGRKIVAGIMIQNLADFRAKQEAIAESIQEAVMLDDQHDRSVYYEVLSANRKRRTFISA